MNCGAWFNVKELGSSLRERERERERMGICWFQQVLGINNCNFKNENRRVNRAKLVS